MKNLGAFSIRASRRCGGRAGLAGAAGALCALMIGFVACKSRPWQGFPAAGAAGLSWPPAPELARVTHVLDIRGHKDLFSVSGFWASFGEMITGSEDSSLSRPYAIALHPSGGLIVTDPGRQCAHFFHWARKKYHRLKGAGPEGLPSPVGVAALVDGRILISDSRLQSVECFDDDGKRQAPFIPKGSLHRPAGIAVNEARGEVYVVDVTEHRIGVYDLQGRPLRWIGGRGEGQGRFNFPTHIATDSQGRLAVSDSMNFQAQIIDPEGSFIRSVGQLGDSPGKFASPKGVAFDPQDRLIVAEGLYGALQFFSPEGGLLLSLGDSGSNPGQFWLPAGLAVDRKEGLLFVADSYNSRVQVFRFREGGAPANVAQ